uniref:Uncharacterized protein n=1 Tax=Zea mays TaxID=4577 RepID=B4FJP9_MAIZE|nr:unknown [Zea mays]|eukprot:NP_001136653.1 uncharacterized protein LOC100216782 [Zea mays]
MVSGSVRRHTSSHWRQQERCRLLGGWQPGARHLLPPTPRQHQNTGVASASTAQRATARVHEEGASAAEAEAVTKERGGRCRWSGSRCGMRWGWGTPASTAAELPLPRGRRRSPMRCSRASPSRASSGSCASSEISRSEAGSYPNKKPRWNLDFPSI